MALAVIAVSALLLTPLLNPEGISARDQISRYEAGLIELSELPLRDFSQGWGIAGQEAWTLLEAMEGQSREALLERRSQELAGSLGIRPDVSATELATALPVLPAGAAIPEGFLEIIPFYVRNGIHDACLELTADQMPLCVAVVADFNGELDGSEAILIWVEESDAHPRIGTIHQDPSGQIVFEDHADTAGTAIMSLSGTEVLQNVHAGTFEIRQPQVQVLDLGTVIVLPPFSGEGSNPVPIMNFRAGREPSE